MSNWDIQAIAKDADYRSVASPGGTSDGLIREILYRGEPFCGSPTEVFAYLGVPDGDEPVPGIVCVHGGDGRAFRRWS